MRSLVKHRNLKWAGISFLAVLVIVLAVSSWSGSQRAENSAVALRRGDLTTAIYGSAQLKTERIFDLKLGTVARITDIRKSLGDFVHAGETILLFDSLSPFKAPIDGILTAIHFRQGETVFAQTTVLTIADAKGFYLEMSLDQKSIRYVKQGQKTRISFDGYRDIPIEGSVRSKFSNGTLFYAVIDLDTVDPSFLPGMSADVAIVTEAKKNVLLAPLGSVREGKLVLLRDGRRDTIPVSLGMDDGTFVEITSNNVKEGERILNYSNSPQQGVK
jgi:membrane fusion protein, macrolide-specific efflux system